MSPRVQLLLHRTSDSACSFRYEIAVVPSDHAVVDTTWNVYRDGLPAAADAS
jgi:hypothetical protein